MNGHPQLNEDFDLYALGALEGEEKQALEVHLRSCTDCRRKVEEARGRVALLALAAPPEVPPRQIRDRLLRQIHAKPVEQPAPPLAAFRRWPRPAFALLLATILLAIATALLVFQNGRLSRRVSELQAAALQQQEETERARSVLEVLTAPDTLQVTLVSGAAQPLPLGKTFYNSRKGLLFYAANLPALPPDQTYQLWLVPAEGNPVSAGIFTADPKGDGAVLLPVLPPGVAAKAFAVTVEPAGGVTQPTGPKVLIGVVS